MSGYTSAELLRRWQQEQLTPEQALGYLLQLVHAQQQLLQAQQQRLRELEQHLTTLVQTAATDKPSSRKGAVATSNRNT